MSNSSDGATCARPNAACEHTCHEVVVAAPLAARRMQRVEGTKEDNMGARIDKIRGRAQQIEGKLTGDKVRVTQGTVTRAKGELEGAAARVTRTVKRGVRRAKAELRSVRNR